jgi:hypothetical protein
MAGQTTIKRHYRQLSNGRRVQVREHNRKRLTVGQAASQTIAWIGRKFVNSPSAIKALTAGIISTGATLGLIAIGVAAGPAVFVVGLFCAAAVVDKVNKEIEGTKDKKARMTGKQLAAMPFALLLDTFFGPVPGTQRVAVGRRSRACAPDDVGRSVEAADEGIVSEADHEPNKRKAKMSSQSDLLSGQMSRQEMPTDPNHDPLAPHGDAQGIDRTGMKYKQDPEIRVNSQLTEQADGTWILTGETTDVDGNVYPWVATSVKSELTPGKPGTLNYQNGVKPSVKAAEATWYKLFPCEKTGESRN